MVEKLSGMLVHQWAEQYRNNAKIYNLAKAFLHGSVFFDCGDSDFTIAGDDLWKMARPPFPNTVIQFVFEHEDRNIPMLIFIRQSADDEFIVFQSIRDKFGWWTSGQFIFESHADGWIIKGDGSPRFFDNDFGKIEVKSEAKSVGNAVSYAWSAFAVLACSNVQTKDHIPSIALNKKRLKAGKLPLVTYKTLEIIVPNDRNEKITAGGSHTSPRLHLRRGHIRRLCDGRIVWVQACIVGSNSGVHFKDYRVRTSTVNGGGGGN